MPALSGRSGVHADAGCANDVSDAGENAGRSALAASQQWLRAPLAGPRPTQIAPRRGVVPQLQSARPPRPARAAGRAASLSLRPRPGGPARRWSLLWRLGRLGQNPRSPRAAQPRDGACLAAHCSSPLRRSPVGSVAASADPCIAKSHRSPSTGCDSARRSRRDRSTRARSDGPNGLQG